MTVKIGEKIRELRKARNISQEVLAQYLGVSFQAVSKWENDTAMPDVILIPAIASFFGVSTDELFDYNRLEIGRKVEAICEEAYHYRETDPAKSEAILREGLKQFPGNDIILNNLLYTLEATERSDEIITICKSLVECTHDDTVKYDALRILAETYHQTGQQTLVEPTLEEIPEIYFTKLELMAYLLEDDKSLDAARKQMWLSFCSVVEMLLIMRDRLREKQESTDASKYERIAKRIVEIIMQEDEAALENGKFCRWCQEQLEKMQ